MKPEQPNSGFFVKVRHSARKIEFDFKTGEIRIYKNRPTVYKNGKKLTNKPKP